MTAWQTIGHNHTKSILGMQLEKDSLSHAYLFTGPKGVGKFDVAKEFARKIIGVEAAAHPDVLLYDIAAQSSIDDMREFLKLAALTPTQAKRKVVIIQNMQEASVAVSNALLKTLEEPQGKTVFILVSDTARVLPTIMSRCTVLRCNRLSLEELREFARNRNLRITDELLSAANGSPHTLTALVNKDASAVAIATQVEQVHEALAQGTAQRLLLAISLAELDTDMIKHILEQWTMRITKTLATHPQRHTAITVAQETLQRLRANANKKMALEYFVLNSQL